MRLLPLAAIVLAPIAVAAPAGLVTEARVLDSEDAARNWLVNAGNYSGDHYSSLGEINSGNVGELGLRWSTDIPMPDGIAGTPIAVDGVIYLSTAWSHVYALDASSGDILWAYRPGVEEFMQDQPQLSWIARANRGAAVWEGLVFVTTADCRLVAIDAQSGELEWSVQSCDNAAGYTLSDAPRVGGGKVFVGNAGSESEKKNRGYMSAYDAKSGSLIWRFYIVPSDDPAENRSDAMKMAAKTWDGDTLEKFGGGGNSWNEMTYDPESKLLFFGTGGSIPYEHKFRSPGGLDNLFISSVMAINAETGEYVWHYQTVPQESWDYNATMNIVLAELNIDGRQRDVAMIAPKNGFFYVFDKLTGELLSAEKFAKVNWATHINLETGRPVLDPAASYWDHDSGDTVAVWPNMWGAHSWQPMAYHPKTGLVYVPVTDIPEIVTMLDEGNWTSDPALVTQLDGRSHDPGSLLAWDPVKQETRWSVAQGRPFNGGILASGSNLVFQGNAKGEFSAYDAGDGSRLWSVSTGSPINSAPITFEIDGRQAVLIAAGAGGGMQFAYPELHGDGETAAPTRVLAFDLGSSAAVPTIAMEMPGLPELPDDATPADKVALGATLYSGSCGSCHGKQLMARPGGTVPDLRYSGVDVHRTWNGIVIGGARQAKGMPKFDIDVDDAEAIRLYILSSSRDLAAR